MTIFLCDAMENRGVINKKIGIFSCQNKKKKNQEDRFYHGNVDGGEWYAIYDGHGGKTETTLHCGKISTGDKIAHFLTETLHDYFSQTSGSISMHERMTQA